MCDGGGRPVAMSITAGQRPDYIGAKTLYSSLSDGAIARAMIADRGYDSDVYRGALRAKGITPCPAEPKVQAANRLLQNAIQTTPQGRKHVGQGPGGASDINRSPLRERPYIRVMFVLSPVSSMNTRLCDSNFIHLFLLSVPKAARRDDAQDNRLGRHCPQMVWP